LFASKGIGGDVIAAREYHPTITDRLRDGFSLNNNLLLHTFCCETLYFSIESIEEKAFFKEFSKIYIDLEIDIYAKLKKTFFEFKLKEHNI